MHSASCSPSRPWLRCAALVALAGAASACPRSSSSPQAVPEQTPVTQGAGTSAGSVGSEGTETGEPPANQGESGTGTGDRNVAGKFDYYLLTLSWSPQFCATRGRQARPDDPQCGDGASFGFVVHGLWPQYESKGWPESCAVSGSLEPSLVERMLKIMPSPRLIAHEWQKHGTCSGLSPSAYFAQAESMYLGLKMPPRFARPTEPVVVSLAEFRSEFLSSNPALPRDGSSLTVHCQGPFLREVRICYTKQFQSRACAGGRDTCPSDGLTIRPVPSRR